MARHLTRHWRRTAAVLWLALGAGFPALALDAPATRVDPVVETLHGTSVADPYRWLEDMAAPETRAWFAEQGTFTRKMLDALPGRAALRERILALGAGDDRVRDLQWAGDRLFYLKRRAGDESYRLYVRDGLAAPERVLVDPAAPGSAERPITIDYFRASPNGQRVAYGIAAGGSEDATLHVLDVDTDKAVGRPIPRARWAEPSWRFDSTVLFYTQQREQVPGAPPADTLKGSRAWQRVFVPDGTVRDEALLGLDVTPTVALAPEDIPSLESSPVSPFVIGVVRHGVQKEISLYVARLTDLRGADTPWRRLAGRDRGIVSFAMRGEWIYVVTHENAPRYRVLRWSLNDAGPFDARTASVVLPESSRVVREIAVAKEALYVRLTDAGYARLVRLPFNPTPRKPPPKARRGTKPPPPPPKPLSGEMRLPFPGTLDELVANPLATGALLRLESWTEAPGYFAFEAKTGAIARTPLLPAARADFGNVAVERTTVRSHDGVAVPVTIVQRKGQARDGSARVLLDAYGAYGVSQDPRFAPSLLAWLERGGVLVVAHVRGGGELGDDWHRAGFRATKPNTWRDVVAVAQWLVQERVTAPERLAVIGSSAGAIAAGRAMIERPDLFAALVSVVGFHDTLRSESAMAGPANVAEFGSIADPQGFRDLLAMSTYAALRDGVAYPAALFTAGLNDPRVDAWDPGKAAARLQAINAGPGGSGRPVLLRVDPAAGHGASTATGRADEYADILSFVLWQTGAADFRLP
jgi:prolyl oligopeptidase